MILYNYIYEQFTYKSKELYSQVAESFLWNLSWCTKTLTLKKQNYLHLRMFTYITIRHLAT